MPPPELLMIPGPTPLPDAVREAMGRPAIGHRSGAFKKVLEDVLPKLRKVFQTERDVLLYTASGTGAMEAALVNTLNPGDRLLSLTCGVFSERFADIGESLGLDVERQSVPYGEPNSVDALRERLAADSEKKIKAVTLIHSETSTGVLNPLKAMAQVIRAHGALVIADTVTSLGAADVRFDEWGLDIAVSGSQKGFMIPPGLSFLALSDRAWAAHQACKNPGYYFNFSKTKKAQDAFTTPYTPATHLILALAEALMLMEGEGLEGIFQRHAQLQAMTRAGLTTMGLDLMVPDIQWASPAVTSVYPPTGISVEDLRAGLKSKFNIVVAGGQKDLQGKIFRVGHLGYVAPENIVAVLNALENVLAELGHAVTHGAAVAAAQQAQGETSYV